MKQKSNYRIKLVVVGIVTIIVLGGGSAKGDFVWNQKADMPTPRWNFATSVVNDKIYAMGGEPSENREIEWVPLSIVEEYNPATDSWTRKADTPTPRVYFSASVVDEKIYMIGGDISGSRVDMYDPASDTWTRKADMPTPRWFLTTCVVNEKIYAIGGLFSWDDYSGLKTVEEYDPVTDSWTKKADMLFGIWGLRAHVVRGKIIAFGGRPDLKSRVWVQEYDPITDTWTRKADMPIGTSSMASALFGDQIVVAGGWEWSNSFPYAAMQMYDTKTDIWTIEDDAPFRRACCSASMVNNRMYVIGGTDRPHPCPASPTVYELTISGPPPDLNGDGIVDSADMCIMVDYWGTDNSLCDIGPMSLGDGIVDVDDLKILAEHLFKDVNDPTLIAHWPLDEVQGTIAYDNASDFDGILIGDPTWQSNGGIVAGALQLDGIDDFVITDHVLNPADGVFSVVVWIQGSAPGQVIISQENGADWLMTDTEGNLITDLKASSRSGKPLLSQTKITDGNWHRIGFVWDGLHRTLYVDGIPIAEDTQDSLGGSDGSLHIGCGKNMEAGTYWSGLIDDIRIYDRVVHP